MKITIESTDKLVSLQSGARSIQARIWQGQAESGIAVHAYVAMISAEIPTTDPAIDQLTAEFDRDLKRNTVARPAVDGLPLRFFLD